MNEKLKELTKIEDKIKEEISKNKKCGLQLKSSNFILVLFIKGKEKSWQLRILEHSKNNLLNGGIYNEARNCYYPSGKSKKDIAEYNKLEKLFKKWGFKHL